MIEAFVFLALTTIIVSRLLEEKRIYDFWKKWEEDSFEFNGARFNKEYYRVVDGKLEER